MMLMLTCTGEHALFTLCGASAAGVSGVQGHTHHISIRLAWLMLACTGDFKQVAPSLTVLLADGRKKHYF